MKKNVLKIVYSLMLGSLIFSNFTACGSQKNVENKPAQEENKQSNRHSRTPQVNGGNLDTSKGEKIYKDGEIVTLADGSKIKYSEDGNHEIIEQGQGKVIIFKTVTEEELSALDDNQRSLVERQMEADSKGFTVVY